VWLLHEDQDSTGLIKMRNGVLGRRANSPGGGWGEIGFLINISMENKWVYQGKPFESKDIGDYVGFVYLITDSVSGKKYIGKKLFVSRHRMPPLKGKTRKRVVIKESDWKTYSGSNDVLKEEVEKRGSSDFIYEIIHLCRGKGEMSYMEAKEQFDRDVLLSDDYYNGIINCKIHKTHVSKLKA